MVSSLPVRRVRDFAISFLQIPPRDGHPCLDGWFRSLRSIGDSHPLNAHHYSTHQASACRSSGFVWNGSGTIASFDPAGSVGTFPIGIDSLGGTTGYYVIANHSRLCPTPLGRPNRSHALG